MTKIETDVLAVVKAVDSHLDEVPWEIRAVIEEIQTSLKEARGTEIGTKFMKLEIGTKFVN